MPPRCFLFTPSFMVSLSNHCRGAALSLAVSLSKEFTLSIVEGPSTISYLLVPGRAFWPPGAFGFGGSERPSVQGMSAGAR